jgi:hypothetical protein
MSDERPPVHGDPAVLEISWHDSWGGALALLPQGAVWPRDPRGVLARLVRGLTGNHCRAWRRVRDLLREADPRLCFETIGEADRARHSREAFPGPRPMEPGDRTVGAEEHDCDAEHCRRQPHRVAQDAQRDAVLDQPLQRVEGPRARQAQGRAGLFRTL